MKNCCLYLLILIVVGIILLICKQIFEFVKEILLKCKHKRLEKLKLEREIKDLKAEIDLQEILIKKKIKEFFNEEDINELEIKEIYEKLKDKIIPCEVDEALEKLENLKCDDLCKDKLKSVKDNLNFIKENQKIETILKGIEKLEKNKNEKKFLKEKKNAL